MQTRYYMRVSLRMLICAFAVAVMSTSLATAQQPASAPPARESHGGLTVTADPWTLPQQYKPTFPKKTPLDGGAIAISVSFLNDTDQPLRVDLDRIRLLLYPPEADRQKLIPLPAEDVADLVLNPSVKDPTATRPRVRIPGTKPKKGRGKDWEAFQAIARNAAIGTNIVEPHSTVRGLLYFDLGRQFDLVGYSRLYIPDVIVMSTGKPLLYFELDLSRRTTR